MKKWLFVMGLTTMLLVACGNEETTEENEDTKSEGSSNESLEVDKGLFNVEVTLPASFFEDLTEEEILANAIEDGIENVIVNPDKTVTYKMSKSEHKKLMEEMHTEVVSSVEEIVNSEDFSSIQEITYAKNFDEFDIKVDREIYENSFDSFVILGLMMSGAYYNLFNGVSGDNLKITFNLIDDATGEIFETVLYPDDLGEEN